MITTHHTPPATTASRVTIFKYISTKYFGTDKQKTVVAVRPSYYYHKVLPIYSFQTITFLMPNSKTQNVSIDSKQSINNSLKATGSSVMGKTTKKEDQQQDVDPNMMNYATFSAPIIDLSFKDINFPSGGFEYLYLSHLTNIVDLKTSVPRVGEKRVTVLASNPSEKHKEEEKKGNRSFEQDRFKSTIFGNSEFGSNKHHDDQNNHKEDEPKEIVKYLGRGVKLCNNNLSDLHGLFEGLSTIMETPRELQWIDLSYNNISCLEGLDSLPETLTSLYLHANQITSLNEIAVLQKFKNLKYLTLFGNPIEEIRNYRFCILSIFPSLKSFDRVTVTERDRQTAETYRNFFWPKTTKRKTTQQVNKKN
nr:unnamed protein product [Naegleria fowleri]